jgi:hypothetical protein
LEYSENPEFSCLEKVKLGFFDSFKWLILREINFMPDRTGY